MIRHHSPVAARATALLAAACLPTTLAAQAPIAFAAQAMVQPLGQTDADLLAQQMRQLASDPRNMTALATAGELSLRLGDLSGAAALFARADKVDARSGRVKAGMGSILVRSERPGEALRFFAQAESYGWPVARYAADRGLAFDLVGQQDRAQRDYRLALANGADDETARRYALSLGISGRQAQALEQLDPLIRRQDRAAWRARAFVMAMNGDTAGAAKIATTMMPAGMAQGLGAFFQRLPTLPAIDRAFAVHFGEIYATPQRLADARLTPSFAPLAPEVAATPVQVAAVAPTIDRRSRRERERAERDARRVALAAARSPSTRLAPSVVVAQPARTAPPATVVAAAPVVAGATMRESNVRVGAPTVPPVVVAAAPVRPVPAPARPVVVAAAPVAVATPIAPRVVAAPPATAAAQPVVVAAAPPVRPAPVDTPAVTAPAPIATVAVPASTPAVPPVAVAASVPVAPVASEAATERADSVLARIVANLSIPASELGVVGPARPDPGPVEIPAAVERVAPSTAGKRVLAEASAKEGRDAALRRTVAAKLTGDPQADEPAVPARTTRGRRGAVVAAVDADTAPTGRRTRTRQGAPDEVEVAAVAEPAAGKGRGRRGAAAIAAAADAGDASLTPAQRRAADRKAAADKKAAADRKELADKAAADKKAARGNPARIWVQVAGGANEAGLGAAWKIMQGRAPTLKTRTGYTTPLRATNRVLTGPFKTDAEARAFVNTLRKEGVAAFAFTSDAGQKVEKLDSKTTAK